MRFGCNQATRICGQINSPEQFPQLGLLLVFLMASLDRRNPRFSPRYRYKTHGQAQVRA
jgi:hypothetical protein